MVSVENKKRIQQRIEGLLLAQRATGLLIDEWMMIGALQMLLQIWQKDGDEEWVGSALFLHFFLTYHVQFVITQIKFLYYFIQKPKRYNRIATSCIKSMEKWLQQDCDELY